MSNKNFEDRNALRKYLRSLSVDESPTMAQLLAEECKVPMSTFNNWRGGNCRIPELAKAKIEEFIGMKIFPTTED